jgi:hypothetical protein
MVRLHLKFTFAMLLLFTGSMALIRFQPHDDTDLRAFVLPADGCPAPCFMGIRPGVTTLSAAVLTLHRHPWITGIRVTQQPGNTLVTWNWLGSRARWIDSHSSGLLIAVNQRVDIVVIQSTISAGEFWLALGQPDNGGVTLAHNRLSGLYTGTYADLAFYFSTRVPCPGLNRWSAPAKITVVTRLSPTDESGSPNQIGSVCSRLAE